MKSIFNLLRKSVMAGVSISLGCIVFLKVGGVAGAVLFSFGLLTVVHYRLALFTGMAGYAGWKGLPSLFVILVGNVLGCFVTALAIRHASPALGEASAAITAARLQLDWLSVLILAIGCGFVMTTAVEFGRKGQYLPLLFGVPLFILSGFIHSIADAFYNCAAWDARVWTIYPVIVLGNYIGCNLYRLFLEPAAEEK